MRYSRLKNKFIKFGIMIIVLCPFSASANESYLAFSSNGYLKQSGELFVNEEFIYDYGKNAKHGLYRNIPLVYEETGKWFGIQNISVKNKDSFPYMFEVNEPGNVVKIKIGDPNITLTGSHYYNLNYGLVNIAGNENIEWKVINRIKEPISKLQAQIFLPKLILASSTSAGCFLVTEEITKTCEITPITEAEFIAGYKIYLENVLNEEIIINVNYPKGTVTLEPLLSDKGGNTRKYTIFVIILVVLMTISSLIILRSKEKLLALYKMIKKQAVYPDQYSYLARAMSYNGKISDEDIIATIIDLRERGYVFLEQQPIQVGINEFIDYSVTVISDDELKGSEGLLIMLLNGHIDSLYQFLITTFEKERRQLEDLALREIENVRMLRRTKEDLPSLIGFKISNKTTPI